MNKKYLSVVLFGALLATSAGTFTSCKDYDDDIKSLQEQINNNGTSVNALQTQLATLKTAAEAAQKTADEAKTAAAAAQTAADQAKAAGDQAAADAATAKALAEEAKAAAAQAKADAIAEAAAQVEALRNSMQAAIDNKLDVTVHEAAVKALGAQIEGIETGLSNLANGAVKENTEAIKNAQDAIETLITADKDLQTQLDALKLYAEGVKDIADANKEDIAAAQEAIEAAQDEIKKLWDEINGEGGLKALIGENKSAIEALKNSTAQDIADLEDKINDELDAIKSDISGIQGDIRTINSQIITINTDLVSLHTLMTCRLSSITFAPDYIVDGVEAIKFNSLKYAPMAAGENAVIPSANYSISTAALATASYHFNPQSFKLGNATYSYADRSATVITTRAAASKLVEIVGTPVKNVATGTVDFKLLRLNAHSTQPAANKTNLVALQAALTGDAVDKGETGVVVTSPYVSVYDDVLDASDVRIADKETLASGDAAHYATTFAAATQEQPRYSMSYNKVFNLKDLVATCFGDDNHAEFPIADYKLSYKFSVATTDYNITTGATTTNQQKWIVCNDPAEGLYQAEGFNKESIGRTPIMKVELVDEAGNVVRRGFVKVEIGVTKVTDLTVNEAAKDLTVKCDATAATYTLDEDFIRTNVYRVITNGKEQSMSHEEFWNLYDATTATAEVKKNNKVFDMSTPKIVDGATGAGTATKKVVWSFTHGELGMIGVGGSQFVATVTVKNKLASSEYPASITFKFTVNVKLPEFALTAEENEIYWDKKEDGTFNSFIVNVNVPSAVTSPASQCQFNQDLEIAYTSYNVTGLTGCETYRYKVIATYSNGSQTSTIMGGVKIEGTHITLDKTNNAVKTALNSKGGLQATVARIYTLESGDEITTNSFMVSFIRPVNMDMPTDVEVMDAKTGGDVADFQRNGLLTDWRGEAIVAPSWSWVEGSRGYWKRNCTTEYELTEGHYELVKAASLNVVKDVVSFTTTVTTTMYTATAEYIFEEYTREWEQGRYSWAWREKARKTFTSEEVLTEAEAASDVEAQSLAYSWPAHLLVANRITKGDISYQESTVLANQEVSYTYVKDIQYAPAEYKWVDGEYVAKPHNHTDRPAYDGTTFGQTSGCWEWTEVKWSRPNWNLGQYWFYYGEFGNITLDIANLTTSLKSGKLPVDATLVQEGNTVKYMNINSPIQEDYTITIPATISYGWGTINTQYTGTNLVIKVKKNN